MKQAGHRDPGTYRKHYAPQNPRTSGQAAYFGNAPRAILNNLVLCVPLIFGSHCQLNRPTISSQSANRLQISRCSMTLNRLGSKEQSFCWIGRSLSTVNAALENFRDEQPSNARKDAPTSHQYVLFSRRSHIMSVRQRLSTSLFTSSSIRGEDGKAVIKDLMTFMRRNLRCYTDPDWRCAAASRTLKTTKSQPPRTGSMFTPAAEEKTHLPSSASSAANGSATRRIGRPIVDGTWRILNWCQFNATPSTSAAVLPLLVSALGVLATRALSTRIA
jgi:hypothetical protein